jgi:hypothetical protein
MDGHDQLATWRTPMNTLNETNAAASAERPPSPRSGRRDKPLLTPVTGMILVATLAGCAEGSTAPDSVDELTSAAVAALAADAALEDLATMDEVVLGPGGALAPPPGAGNFERERTVTFYDASGAQQDAHDPLTTASIRFVLSLEGEVSREGFSASIERHRDIRVTGLLGEEETRTWNGEGDSRWERVRVNDDGEHSYVAEGTLVIDDVVRAVDRAAHPWPLSGTITRTVEITITNGPNGDETRERTVVITFDGTQFATLTIDGEPANDVDLATREGRSPLRRHRGGRD